MIACHMVKVLWRKTKEKGQTELLIYIGSTRPHWKVKCELRPEVVRKSVSLTQIQCKNTLGRGIANAKAWGRNMLGKGTGVTYRVTRRWGQWGQGSWSSRASLAILRTWAFISDGQLWTILGRSEDLIYIKRKTSLADVLKIHYTVGK